MRFLSFIIIYCACATQLYAQNGYVPFATHGAMWRYSEYNRDNTPSVREIQLMMNGEDTIIKGIAYKKVMTREIGYIGDQLPKILIAIAPDKFWGGFREEQMRTYIFYPHLGRELMVYDFYNKKVGDIVTFPMENDTLYARIKAISTNNIAGKDRMVIETERMNEANYKRTYIAGIGGMGEGLHYLNRPTYMNTATTTWNMTYIEGNYRYPYTNTKYIYPYGTAVGEDIAAYPNPFISTFQVNSVLFTKAELVNSLGQLIMTITPGHNTYNAAHLERGIYFLQFKDKNNLLLNVQTLLKQQ